MRVIADICVIPLSGSTSVREPVARAYAILEAADLDVQLHAYGTNVQGEMEAVLAAIAEIHEALHADGIPRISTTIKLGSRVDKAQSLDDKVDAVHAVLDAD